MSEDQLVRIPALRSIEAFIWICRLGSFKAASRKLCVTVSAVSRRIQALEQEIGVTLFDRQSRDLRITAAGERFLAHTMPAFDALIAATRDFYAHQDQASVRISVGSAFENHWLTPRLCRFFDRHPGSQVHLVTANDPRVQILNVDASIWFGPTNSEGDDIERIVDIARYPVCHPSLVESGGLSTPRDLRNHVMIDLVTSPHAWPEWLSAAGLPDLKPRSRLTVDNLDSGFHAASKGLGVCIGIAYLVDSYMARGELVAPFGTELSAWSTIYLVLNPTAAGRPIVQAFRRWFIGEARAGLSPLPS